MLLLCQLTSLLQDCVLEAQFFNPTVMWNWNHDHQAGKWVCLPLLQPLMKTHTEMTSWNETWQKCLHSSRIKVLIHIRSCKMCLYGLYTCWYECLVCCWMLWHLSLASDQCAPARLPAESSIRGTGYHAPIYYWKVFHWCDCLSQIDVS